MHHKLTDTLFNQYLRLRETGHDPAQILKQLDASSSVLRSAERKAQQFPQGLFPPRPLCEDAKAAYEAGARHDEIADSLGIPMAQVLKLFEKSPSEQNYAPLTTAAPRRTPVKPDPARAKRHAAYLEKLEKTEAATKKRRLREQTALLKKASLLLDEGNSLADSAAALGYPSEDELEDDLASWRSQQLSDGTGEKRRRVSTKTRERLEAADHRLTCLEISRLTGFSVALVRDQLGSNWKRRPRGRVLSSEINQIPKDQLTLIYRLADEGHCNREIADHLDLSLMTILKYVGTNASRGLLGTRGPTTDTEKIALARKLARAGASNEEIAEKTGHASSWVYRHCGSQSSRNLPRKSGMPAKTRAKMLKLAEKGARNAEIAAKTGLTINTITKYCGTNASRGLSTAKQDSFQEHSAQIQPLAEQGLSNRQIVEQLGLSTTTVVRCVGTDRARGIKREGRSILPDATIAKMKRLAKQGKRNAEIAEKAGVTVMTVIAYCGTDTSRGLPRGRRKAQ